MKLRNNPLLQELISTSVSPAFNFFVRKHWSYHFASAEIPATDRISIRLFFFGFPYILQNSGELCAVSSDVIAAIRCNSQTKTFILVRTFLTFWPKGREKQSRGWKRTMSMERYFSTQLKQRLNQTGKYVFL